jgi:hypothetical protein
MMFRKKYLLKSMEKDKAVARSIPGLPASVLVQRLNVMEESHGTDEPVGFVFCRMGNKNSEFVPEFLRMEAITVVRHDPAGRDNRRTHFHTETSDVFLKRIPFTRYPNIGHEERSIPDSLRKKAEESADVTLFT